MAQYKERLNALVVKLHEIDVLKFGDFKMKIGVNSPVYFDLRIIVSYPKVLVSVSISLTLYIKLFYVISIFFVNSRQNCRTLSVSLPRLP